MTSTGVFFIVWGILNIVSFAVFSIDKFQSKRGKTRIPEAVLFMSMIYMGTLGGVLAMLAFRHKIKKWYFWLSLPMLIFENYLVFEFVNGILYQ